ncbi:MAG: alanine--tRNA ligase [Thermoleophilia bacterium]|nr:alanine--tRNA ligase [Thermoleophilia bacterium]
MTTKQIRRAYLDYFIRNGHTEVASSSLVPFDDDPSVLLTIAGMQPLKAYFMGTEDPPSHRLTSCQKCFRTGDIDQIGHTARHLTFFEMLGNFSLGDYFKKEAIRFGWEVSTEVFGMDPERIWITVFEGMDGVPGDDEAVEYWIDQGIPAGRIQRLGEADNFWKAGPTGPCGPNTELYFDRGPAFGPDGGPATGGDRFLEYWNLVFMQYERSEDGSLRDLPAQNIDTGAGLERIAALLQDKPSVFETDAFWPLIEWGKAAAGVDYGKVERVDRALRVLADHGRAMTFLAGDGVRPSNEGRGFVMRRIVRRAVSEAATLGLAPEAIVDLGGVVIELWGDAYPALRDTRAAIDDTLGTEAEQFARTLQSGRRLLTDVVERSRATGTVSGDDAFRLHDTYGFPLDLTLEAAADAGLAVDTEGFEALMNDQRTRSRAGSALTGETSLAVKAAGLARGERTRFVGYDALAADATVVASEPLEGDEQLVRLDVSPFYAQGGGQVSDTGVLVGGAGRWPVTDVLRVGGDQVLRVAGPPLEVGTALRAEVDAAARAATQGHHTATHILHWALRDRLGTDVHQAGSYVGPDKLRFDVTHRGRIAPEQLAEVERMVNDRIAEDTPVTWTEMPKAEADARGAIGLFGEKYGDVVRVVEAGDYSKELCGGTHVSRTSEIGGFHIVHEGSVGAGARRIEALTGTALMRHHAARAEALEAELAQRDARIADLEARLKDARAVTVDPAALVAGATEHGDVRAVVAQIDAPDADALLAIADQVRAGLGDGAAVVLGSAADGKATLIASLGSAAIASGLAAGVIIKEIAPLVGGGGGGKPQMARAGGKDPAGLPKALDRAREMIGGA